MKKKKKKDTYPIRAEAFARLGSLYMDIKWFQENFIKTVAQGADPHYYHGVPAEKLVQETRELVHEALDAMYLSKNKS